MKTQLIPMIKTKAHHWEAVGIVDDMSIHAIINERDDGSCKCTVSLVHNGTGYERSSPHQSVDHALFFINRMSNPLGFEFQVVKTATT